MSRKTEGSKPNSSGPQSVLDVCRSLTVVGNVTHFLGPRLIFNHVILTWGKGDRENETEEGRRRRMRRLKNSGKWKKQGRKKTNKSEIKKVKCRVWKKKQCWGIKIRQPWCSEASSPWQRGAAAHSNDHATGTLLTHLSSLLQGKLQQVFPDETNIDKGNMSGFNELAQENLHHSSGLQWIGEVTSHPSSGCSRRNHNGQGHFTEVAGWVSAPTAEECVIV